MNTLPKQKFFKTKKSMQNSFLPNIRRKERGKGKKD